MRICLFILLFSRCFHSCLISRFIVCTFACSRVCLPLCSRVRSPLTSRLLAQPPDQVEVSILGQQHIQQGAQSVNATHRDHNGRTDRVSATLHQTLAVAGAYKSVHGFNPKPRTLHTPLVADVCRTV